jgi:hypothetical protein
LAAVVLLGLAALQRWSATDVFRGSLRAGAISSLSAGEASGASSWPSACKQWVGMQCKQWVVTIFKPGWCLVVAADEGAPSYPLAGPNMVVLDMAAQEAIGAHFPPAV